MRQIYNGLTTTMKPVSFVEQGRL